MRTLASTLLDALAQPVTQPGYLVEILFATPFRVSSRGNINWGGNSWGAFDFKVSGLGVDGSTSSQSGSLTFGNDDHLMSALVLNEGVAGRTIHVWKFSGEAPEDADPINIFSGIGDDVQGNPSQGELTINLTQEGAQTLFCPRRRITADQGFNFLPPAGTLIVWNTETYQLESDSISG